MRGESLTFLRTHEGQVADPVIEAHNCCLNLEGPAMVATPRFVGQSLYTLRQKPLDPFVDKATAYADRGSHVGDRYPIGDE